MADPLWGTVESSHDMDSISVVSSIAAPHNIYQCKFIWIIQHNLNLIFMYLI